VAKFVAFAVYAAAVLSPQAVAYTRLRWGATAGLLAYATLCGLALVFTGPLFALEVATVFGACGLFIAMSVKAKFGAERVYLSATVPLLLTAAVSFALLLNFKGDMTVREYIDRTLSVQLESNAQETSDSAQQPKLDPKVEERIERLKGFVVLAYPSINIALIALLVLIHLIWLKELWPETAKRANIQDLSTWRAREFLIWPFLASGFTLLAPKDSMLFAMGLNLFIIMTLPFLFQGMAITSFFMKKYNLPKIARAFVYILLFSQLWVVILVFIGLADVWADLRKLKGAQAV